MKKTLLLFLILLYLASPVKAQNGSKGLLIINSIDLVEQIYTCPLINKEHQILPRSVCWLEDTEWIDGTPEFNLVLAGHTPGVFSDLIYVQIGDIFSISRPPEVHRYIIAERYITYTNDPAWVSPFLTPHRVTFITCHGNGWLILIGVPYND